MLCDNKKIIIAIIKFGVSSQKWKLCKVCLFPEECVFGGKQDKWISAICAGHEMPIYREAIRKGYLVTIFRKWLICA